MVLKLDGIKDVNTLMEAFANADTDHDFMLRMDECGLPIDTFIDLDKNDGNPNWWSLSLYNVMQWAKIHNPDAKFTEADLDKAKNMYHMLQKIEEAKQACPSLSIEELHKRNGFSYGQIYSLAYNGFFDGISSSEYFPMLHCKTRVKELNGVTKQMVETAIGFYNSDTCSIYGEFAIWGLLKLLKAGFTTTQIQEMGKELGVNTILSEYDLCGLDNIDGDADCESETSDELGAALPLYPKRFGTTPEKTIQEFRAVKALSDDDAIQRCLEGALFVMPIRLETRPCIKGDEASCAKAGSLASFGKDMKDLIKFIKDEPERSKPLIDFLCLLPAYSYYNTGEDGTGRTVGYAFIAVDTFYKIKRSIGDAYKALQMTADIFSKIGDSSTLQAYQRLLEEKISPADSMKLLTEWEIPSERILQLKEELLRNMAKVMNDPIKGDMVKTLLTYFGAYLLNYTQPDMSKIGSESALAKEMATKINQMYKVKQDSKWLKYRSEDVLKAYNEIRKAKPGFAAMLLGNLSAKAISQIGL